MMMSQEKVNEDVIEVMKEMIEAVTDSESTVDEFFSWVTVDLLSAFSFEGLLPSGDTKAAFEVSESFRGFAVSLVVCGDRVVVSNYKNNDARMAS